MTYRELWQTLAPRYGDGEAKSIARMVFADRFGLSMADLCMGKDSELSANERAETEKIASRLLSGEPVQYVIGSVLFCGNRFIVRPGVLIPRPETADLVGMAVDYCRTLNAPPSVLDIGTGSGCIAVCIAKAIAQARVVAWDVSREALDVAAENARLLNADVEIVEQDALNPPADTALWDCIVSNPPYIARRERAAMEPHVLDHEPPLALFVSDDDPVVFYRSIARYAHKALKKGGVLIMEINSLYVKETVAAMQNAGFGEVEVVKDLFGKDRFVSAKR